MARLIDADELLELYDMGEELEDYASVLSVPIPVIRQNIKDMPVVDAVEVVRCKDCQFAPVHPTDSQKLVCTKSVNWRAVEPEHYCSYGERRTDCD